jgi:hypothetical protein
MNLFNRILAGVLVIQVVLGAIIFFPSGSSSKADLSSPLLEAFVPADVNEMTISDNTGKTVKLERDENGEWTLPDSDNFPARTSRLDDVLAKMATLKADRLIAQNQSSFNRLQVSDDTYQRLITYKTSGSDETHTLYVGSSGGGDSFHMRLSDSNNVYLTSGLATWEIPTELSSWIDTQYFGIERDNLKSITVENANGAFEFTKDGDTWRYNGLADGEVFDPDSITTLLTRITSVRMTQPLGKTLQDSYGMTDPEAVVTLVVDEPVETEAEATEEPPQMVERTYTLTFGNQAADSSDHIFFASNADYYVEVGSFVADTVLNLNHDDLLVKPEDLIEPQDSGESS